MFDAKIVFNGLRTLTVALGVMGPCGAWADDWSGKGEGGIVLSRGNADATTANAKLDVAKEDGPWKNSVTLALLYGRNADFTTAQRIEGHYQLDHTISDKLFGFISAQGDQDKFEGFAYQGTASGGLGYKFLNSDATKLTGSIGVGYRRLQPEVLDKSSAGQILSVEKEHSTGSAVATVGLDFQQQLTATTKVLDKLLGEPGANNSTVQNDLSLQVSISAKLALNVGYGIHYNSNPPTGAVRLDQLTTINFVYNINPKK